MILDRWENANRYLGLSPAMDCALRFLSQKACADLPLTDREELDGERAFYFVSEPETAPKEMNFEFHKRYADIHAPLTGVETIALCPAATRPQDTPFEGDIGFFRGEAVNVVRVPAGWFCICFPDDAHVPCMGDGQRIRKLVIKVQA